MGIDPISIGLMAAGTLISGIGAINGASEQRKQLRAQQRMEDVRDQQQRLEQVRQANTKRAQILQAGANQGAGDSSSVTTGASGVTASEEQNINFIDKQAHINGIITQAQNGLINDNGIQQLGGGITSLGGTIFGNDKYIEGKINSIFGSTPSVDAAPEMRGSFSG